ILRGVRQQQDEPGRFSICSRQAAVVQRAPSGAGPARRDSQWPPAFAPAAAGENMIRGRSLV
ncbi:hypothetical protein B9019_027075, partial [Klebsiella pneumoniae]